MVKSILSFELKYFKFVNSSVKKKKFVNIENVPLAGGVGFLI